VPAEVDHNCQRDCPVRRHAARGRRRTRVLGVVQLKDVVKGGIKERFARFGRWGCAP